MQNYVSLRASRLCRVLVLGFLCFPAYPQGTISTVAGTGTAGFSGDSGAATSAALNEPNGIDVDGGGNLYIADFLNSRIRKVTPGGLITTVAGTGIPGFSGDGGIATTAQLNYPSAVEVDNAGNLYIADTSNHRIRKVTPGGIISTVAGNGSAGFSGDGGLATSAGLWFPLGVTADNAGNFYIADAYNNRIRKVTTAGIISTVAGNGGNGFSGDGASATGATLSQPSGSAVDAQGNLFVADRLNNRIRKVTPAGIITTVAGTGIGGFDSDGGAATAAALFYPSDVAVDSNGSIYVADQGNHRIRKVTPMGVISTVAGTGTGGFGGDGGAPTSAQLNIPVGVAVDAVASIYIADSVNNRVRRIISPGIRSPSVDLTGPLASSGTSQSFVFKFSHPDGFQRLNVVNVLINQYLDGGDACYLAYSVPFRTMYLVNDRGPSSGLSPGITLGTSTSVNNSQCVVNGQGSSAVGDGTVLTLTINITFKPSFTGSKVIYLAAGDVLDLNSGWKTVGAHAISILPTYPRPVLMSPASGTAPTEVLTFQFEDASNADNLQTVWVLMNTAIDGRQACYLAYYRPGNLLFLYPDNGDGTQATSIPVIGANVIENSQCRISALGSSVTKLGSRLTLTLNLTWKSPFSGFRGVWSAAQTVNGVVSPWVILGAWKFPN